MRYVTSMHCLSLFRPAVGTCFVCVATPVASGPAVLFRTQRATALCADLVLSELSTLVLNEPKADVTRTASQTQDPRPPPTPLHYISILLGNMPKYPRAHSNFVI